MKLIQSKLAHILNGLFHHDVLNILLLGWESEERSANNCQDKLLIDSSLDLTFNILWDWMCCWIFINFYQKGLHSELFVYPCLQIHLPSINFVSLLTGSSNPCLSDIQARHSLARKLKALPSPKSPMFSSRSSEAP